VNPVLAYLKEWDVAGEKRRRVDLALDCEPWLTAYRPHITPLYARPDPETAAALAHRVCCGTEHDPSNGKLHGYCVVCGVPWPCETAQSYLRRPTKG
jgi:hypothetical protein